MLKGIVKVMSKMGICTIDGYRGAEIFEALGLDPALVDPPLLHRHGLAVGGAGLAVIAEETLMRPLVVLRQRGGGDAALATGGQYQWRSDGEHHNFNPLTVHKLQVACRTGNYATYQERLDADRHPGAALVTLRNLLEFVAPQPVPIDDVESIESICKRFKTGAMSLRLAEPRRPARRMAIAMNRIGGKSNCGEGGEDAARYQPLDANGDVRSSAIKQVASPAGSASPASTWCNAQEIADQDGAGREAGRGRPAARPQGVPVDRAGRASSLRAGVGLISPPAAFTTSTPSRIWPS